MRNNIFIFRIFIVLSDIRRWITTFWNYFFLMYQQEKTNYNL